MGGGSGGRQLGMSAVSLLTKALSLELSTVLASDLIWHSLAGHISPDACLPAVMSRAPAQAHSTDPCCKSQDFQAYLTLR